MLPFRLRTDARTWFRELREREKTFRLDFDPFYFCFMAGIAARQKRDVLEKATAELVDYFPDRYTGRGRLLVALFLTRELAALGLTSGEKHDIHVAIAGLVSFEARNYLSADGVREFNKYAHGGFDVLLDWFDDRPRSLETFVRAFKRKLDAALLEAA